MAVISPAPGMTFREPTSCPAPQWEGQSGCASRGVAFCSLREGLKQLTLKMVHTLLSLCAADRVCQGVESYGDPGGEGRHKVCGVTGWSLLGLGDKGVETGHPLPTSCLVGGVCSLPLCWDRLSPKQGSWNLAASSSAGGLLFGREAHFLLGDFQMDLTQATQPQPHSGIFPPSGI